MNIIGVPDLNDSVGYVTFEDKGYYIRFLYNPSFDYWTFGLYDTALVPIIPEIKIVPNTPLLHYYKYTDLPPGWFVCVSSQDRVGRKDFVENHATFGYMPEDEMDYLFGDLWRTG